MCTLKCRGKLRYRGIDTVYVGVKLLYKHDGTPQGSLTKRFLVLSPNDRKEMNVGKIWQNNMALWMNATFLKVLKEVLFCLPIMEPNVKRGNGRIRRRRPRTKKVSSWSGFALRCHTHSIQERERERGNTSQTELNRKKIKDMYAWNMHEHVTCKI